MGYDVPDVYYQPENFDLETVGEIEWYDEPYEFNLTVVWRRKTDGKFFTASDSGCSCPSPFEDYTSVTDLEVVGSLAEFKLSLEAKQEDGKPRAAEIAELLEKMHNLGAR